MVSNQVVINRNKRKYLDGGKKNPENVIRIHGAESFDHFIKKCEVCYNLKREGRTFVTEAKLKENKFVPDILVIDIEPMEAIEIMKSETKESIVKKSQKYDGIRILQVQAPIFTLPAAEKPHN